MKHTGKIVVLVIVILSILGAFVLSGYVAYLGIRSCEDYARVYDHPLHAVATVHRHDSYLDSDDDKRYTSFIKYEVSGQFYSNIEYQDTTDSSKLLPIGKRIEVTLNPEKPGQLMKDIAEPVMAVIPGLFCLLIFSFIAGTLRRRRLTREMHASVDRDTAARDLHIAIRSRTFRPFWLGGTLYLSFLILRYPMVFHKFFGVAVGACFLFWIYCMYTTIRDSLYVYRDQFYMQRDVLIEKKVTKDSDGDPEYRLYYRGAKHSWEKAVTYDAFRSTPEGHTLQAVYLPNKKHPTIHYNNGNAVI